MLADATERVQCCVLPAVTPLETGAGRVSNGGTEAVNLIIEKVRRLARAFRTFDHYRIRIPSTPFPRGSRTTTTPCGGCTTTRGTSASTPTDRRRRRQRRWRPRAPPPRRDDLAGLPVAWIGVGKLDLFYAEDLAHTERLTAAGVPCELVVVPGMFHGTDAGFGGKAPSMLEFRAAMRRTLGAALAPA